MIDNSKMKMFNHLWNEIDATYHDAALKLKLSDSAMIILYTICNNGDSCMIGDITRLSGISKQTINSSLRKLETDGIIYLELVGLRKKRVCLTEKGKRFAEDTVLKIINIENKIYNSWTKAELDLYLELTQRFLHDFENEIKKL